MKSLKALFILSLLAFPFVQAEEAPGGTAQPRIQNEELTEEQKKELEKLRIKREKRAKKRVEEYTKRMQDGAQDCALMGFLEKRRGKLSETEKGIENYLGIKYNDVMFIDAESMTVSEYLQLLRSKNDKGMTIKEIFDGNTETTWFSLGRGDVCYRGARSMENHEKILLEFEAQGNGDKEIRCLPELIKALKNIKI